MTATNKIKILIALIFFIFFFGYEKIPTDHHELKGLLGTSIIETKLSDGTPCVILRGAYACAISCNWK